jgi:YggT family protein
MIGFIFDVLDGLFSAILFVLFCYMVLSWLVFFNIVNLRNPTAWRVHDVLDRITAPILEPFRRFIPSVGGLDISFLIAFIVIGAIQAKLLPLAETNLYALVGS